MWAVTPSASEYTRTVSDALSTIGVLSLRLVLAATEVIGITGISLTSTEELIAEPVVLLRTISDSVDMEEAVVAVGIAEVAATVDAVELVVVVIEANTPFP